MRNKALAATEPPRTPAPPVRVPHPLLSLWQSAVNQTLAEQAAKETRGIGGADPDPYRAAVGGLAMARHLHAQGKALAAPDGDQHEILAHGLNACMAEVRGPVVIKQCAIDAVRADVSRRFSNKDLEFVISCVEHFIEWYLHSGPVGFEIRRVPIRALHIALSGPPARGGG